MALAPTAESDNKYVRLLELPCGVPITAGQLLDFEDNTPMGIGFAVVLKPHDIGSPIEISSHEILEIDVVGDLQ